MVDNNRRRKTYSFLRKRPVSGADSVLSGGQGIELSGNHELVTISFVGAAGPDSDWTLSGSTFYTTSSVAVGVVSGSALDLVPTGAVLFVSGVISGSQRVVFGGDVHVSGALSVGTGSITIENSEIRAGTQLVLVDPNSFGVKRIEDLVLHSHVSNTGSAIQPWRVADDDLSVYVTSSIVIGQTGSVGDNTVFYVSGTADGTTKAVMGDAVYVSGSISMNLGLSGSLTSLLDGTAYLNASGTVSVSTQSSGQVFVSGSESLPSYTLQVLNGTTTTFTHSQDPIGGTYFNRPLLSRFGGGSTYNWRVTLEAPWSDVAAKVDLYDVDGIVNGTPGVVAGSTLSSSLPYSALLEADLTSQLSTVTGSGILEARLWKAVGGSVTASVTCHGAWLDVEFG